MLFGRDDLLRVLHGFNPWWSGRVPVLSKFRRPLYTACRRHVESRSGRFVLLVSGLRGTGKTTILFQLATDLITGGTDPRSVLYLGMGHPIFGKVPLPQILQLYRELVHPKDKSAILLLDELHYARDWDQHIKALLFDQSGYRIVATESVQMIERALVTETQHIRWNAIAAPTLSFHEYLMLRGIDPGAGRDALDLARPGAISQADLDEAARVVRPAAAHFRTFLATGGLPWLAVHEDDPGSRGLWQEDAVENILRRDIALHFGARNVEDLKRLFVFLCMHSGDVFPVQRYARAVEVSASTVTSHLDLLERCFLIRRLAPVGSGAAEVQKARYRVFVSDTTLRNAQLLRDAESLTDPEEMQRVVLTSVVRHVIERFAKSLVQFRYWRDPRTRGQVDLIVREEGRQTVYQNMYERPRTLKANDPVLGFCRRERVTRAVLVTAEENDLTVFRIPGIDTEFVKVPAHLLLYLLGVAENRAMAK